MNHPNWADVPSRLLNIQATLTSGQCFRWERTADGGWCGAVDEETIAWLLPRNNGFEWQTFPDPDRWDVVAHYFALDIDLDVLRESWADADPRLREVLWQRAGLRVLRQPLVETLFTFLCASCNTMTKIGRSVRGLAQRYGIPVVLPNGQRLYRFPDIASLAQASEAALREDLWGFRAPRVVSAARALQAGPVHTADLAAMTYDGARAFLRSLDGIGAKVADCICLFALGHTQAVPVDTHVRAAAVERYRPDLAGRSLTPSVYDALADSFRDRFGTYAGWLQQYLFVEHATRPRGGSTQPVGGMNTCSSTTR